MSKIICDILQNKYDLALKDYEAASNIFIALRDVARYSDARANYALTLYQLDRTEEAVRAMKDVTRKNPGYADMHVAIAADAWSKGDYLEALKVLTIPLILFLYSDKLKFNSGVEIYL